MQGEASESEGASDGTCDQNGEVATLQQRRLGYTCTEEAPRSHPTYTQAHVHSAHTPPCPDPHDAVNGWARTTHFDETEGA